MINGKVRSESHLIDQDAILTIKRKLPREWVVRELTPDYGLDLDVELFEKENKKIVTLGERLYIQVKGTTAPKYQDKGIDIDGKKIIKKYVSFSIDTALLKLVERVGNSLPVLLAVVDVNTEDAFIVSLNDYVDFVLCDDEKWRTQATKTIYIPYENKIELVYLLRWYAIRPKLQSFFTEAAALMVDVDYEANPEGYMMLTKRFAVKHRESDVWNCKKIGFSFLDKAHELIKNVSDGTNCSDCDIIFGNFTETDYISTELYENMPLMTAKQLYTCSRLIEELGNANCIFSSCIRQLFIRTKYEALISM